MSSSSAHLRACSERHYPAVVEHAAGLDLAVGEFVHRLQEFRRRRPWAGPSSRADNDRKMSPTTGKSSGGSLGSRRSDATPNITTALYM